MLICQQSVNLFHGTNFSALPGIIKYGLNSVDESLRNGIEVNSGEEWSRINGGRSFVSLTDVLHIAEYYSCSGIKNEQSFNVLIGTNVDSASSIGFHIVHSDIPEVAVKSSLPLECIRAICVPSDKIDYVKRIVGDKPIKILAVDDINDKFYCIEDMCFITIFEEKYNEFKQGLTKKRKKFNIGEIKTIVEKFTISKFKDLLNKFRDLLSGGKELDYGRRSTK